VALRAGGEWRDARGKRAIVPHNRTLAADPAPHGSWRQLVEAVEQVEALRAERDESVINQAARGRASASLLEVPT
jgi:hypothetical protein